MPTQRRYRGATITNPNGENFSEFYGTPLPENTEDMQKWAKALLAALDTNFAQLETSIQGIGADLRQKADAP